MVHHDLYAVYVNTIYNVSIKVYGVSKLNSVPNGLWCFEII